MEVFKKSGTKERLFEMMEKVNKVSLNESNIPQGTTIAIADVSPETIPVGEALPSPNTADASSRMLTPSHIEDWKNEFISNFGQEGEIVKGLNLSWSWGVQNNPKYEAWKTERIAGKARDLDNYSRRGWSTD